MIPEKPRIRVGAVDETLLVNPSLISDCDCSIDSDATENDVCDNNPLECGICDCGEDYTDEVCRAEGTGFLTFNFIQFNCYCFILEI